MIESYSHEQLLAWVNEASDDPSSHVLLVSTKRGMHKFLHKSSREARSMMMQFQSFDPDLVKFEEHRPATAEEISQG